MRESRCSVQITSIRTSTPQLGLAAMHRSNVTWVYVAVLPYIRCSPPYRDHALHFHAPRLIALREGDRNEETPTTENEGGMLMRRACARTLSPRSFLLLEHSLQPTPSPLCGLALWPLLGACSMYLGESNSLTRLDLEVKNQLGRTPSELMAG